jgi:parvulin-like peptidyl-prolyl isomerase
MKLAVLLLLVLAQAASVRAATPDLINGIAVIVGGSVVTYKDVQLALRDDIQILERRYSRQPDVFKEKASELEKAKIEDLVENQLVLQEFKRAGYVVPESYVQNRIDEDIKKFGDRLNLVKTLQAEGITFETYRTRIRERVILDLMWRQKVPVDPLISPAKIENYYVQNLDKFKMEDQAKLRMIVLNNTAQSSIDAKKLAEEILTKIKSGVPFEEMAKLYSQGSQAAQGGDWGWVEKKVLREDLADVAFKLKPGELSNVIETSQGVFIMKVEEFKVAYTKTLSEVRDEIEATLKAEENKRLRTQWIDQLKAKSFVRYF